MQVSDVSLDSSGFPKALQSPRTRLFTKRPGSRLRALALGAAELDEVERSRMGFPAGGVKRPAAAEQGEGEDCPRKRPAARVAAAGNDALQGPGPWLKLQKTVAKNPERSYLLGTKAAGSKPRLIVEVSRVRSRQHSFIIDRLRDALAEQNLSKEAALELRDTLCAQYP